jgi:hypothetical protein
LKKKKKMTDPAQTTSPFHAAAETAETDASWRVGVMASIVRGISENLPATGVLAVGLSQGWKLAMSGNSLMFTAGVLVGCLFGAKSGVEQWELGVKSSKLFNAPETQDVIAKLAAMANDVSSVQKGTIWLVKQSDDAAPSIMTQSEYTKFRNRISAEGRQLDEIKIDGKGLTVRRFIGPGLDSGERGVPAFERIELSESTVERTATSWFSKGRKVTPEYAETMSRNAGQPALAV